jgi:hypothetical protein
MLKTIKLILILMIINVSQTIALNNGRNWLYPRINENPECKYILLYILNNITKKRIKSILDY